jgi:hypothetical protein
MMSTRACLTLLSALLLTACGGKVVVDGNSGSGGATSSTTGAGGGAVDCDPGPALLCNSPMPTCDPGQVPSVLGGCWGQCVPILSCAPVPSCDGCQGFCVAYESWTTEYRCVMPALQCSAFACSCMAPYFCAGQYDACNVNPSGTPMVTCQCTTC